MSTEDKIRCPLCQRGDLTEHCGENEACDWLQCPRPSCKARLSAATGKGFGLNPKNPEYGFVEIVWEETSE